MSLANLTRDLGADLVLRPHGKLPALPVSIPILSIITHWATSRQIRIYALQSGQAHLGEQSMSLHVSLINRQSHQAMNEGDSSPHSHHRHTGPFTRAASRTHELTPHVHQPAILKADNTMNFGEQHTLFLHPVIPISPHSGTKSVYRTMQPSEQPAEQCPSALDNPANIPTPCPYTINLARDGEKRGGNPGKPARNRLTGV
ncbi:hypothetical protein GGS21DRAFT_489531 [Xylaria nigripes]|nr:hypothetical protein GGS21DRAFT_489531 [Xylaria nigripes]